MLFTIFCATGFTFLMTAAGAGMVFFFQKEIPDGLHRFFLGFAAGVMIAASVWSLLIPAMEQAAVLGFPQWLPASCGIFAGCLFLFIFEKALQQTSVKHPHFFCGFPDLPKNLLLIFAITLHNIPEGMAVGLAWPIALGIGIQNFPEGAAVSLPLRKNGFSKLQSFLIGSATGIAEPVFGLLTFLVARQAALLLPWLLSFAAGAMLYVAAGELIPGSHKEESFARGTFGVITGFLLMMILDVSLG